MDQLSPLIPIEQYAFIKTFSLYILSYHLHPKENKSNLWKLVWNSITWEVGWCKVYTSILKGSNCKGLDFYLESKLVWGLSFYLEKKQSIEYCLKFLRSSL